MSPMNGDASGYGWIEEFPSPITVCDTDGIIIAMNKASCSNFQARGGAALIGTSLFACHPEEANKKIRKMLQKETAQTYIVENNDGKKLVHQSPWYRNRKFAGLVETIIDLPGEIAVRKRN